MSNSPLKVLVVGPGNVGTAILKALAKPQYSVKVESFTLVRPQTLHSTDPAKVAKLETLRQLGVTLLEGESTPASVDALAALLKSNSIHTVISTLPGTSSLDQLPLVKAAKKGGVVRFFPSEFGGDVEKIVNEGDTRFPLATHKVAVQKAVKDAGLQYTLVQPGLVTEMLLSLRGGFDFTNHTITAVSFDQIVTTTSFADVADFTVEVLLNPTTINQTIYLAGETLAFEQLARIIEKVAGRPFKRITKSKEQLAAAVAADPTDFASRFALLIGNQVGLSWPAEESWNRINVPNHKITPVEEVVRRTLNKQ